MELSFVLAVCLFALATSITPGPNNMMLLASGAQHGFRRTLPHMIGITGGMILLLSCVLLGLGAMFQMYPAAYEWLKWLGGAYLLWLSFKIAFAPVGRFEEQGRGHPFRWWQATLFQFVNPKAWMMSIGGISSFALSGDQYFYSGVWIILLFALMNFPSIGLWAAFGAWISRLLTNTDRQRWFNWIMGSLTMATLLLMVME